MWEGWEGVIDSPCRTTSVTSHVCVPWTLHAVCMRVEHTRWMCVYNNTVIYNSTQQAQAKQPKQLLQLLLLKNKVIDKTHMAGHVDT